MRAVRSRGQILAHAPHLGVGKDADSQFVRTANRVGMLTKFSLVLQPMCEDITNGVVKMEWDMRMPKAWNTDTARASIILTTNKGYDKGYEFAYSSRLLSLGFCST